MSHMQTGSPRITPAGAGKTWNNGAGYRGTQDHPRRCGENVEGKGYIAAQKGSPPQVRGKLRSIPERGAYLRITPAGAGKTDKTIWTQSSKWDHPRRCGENPCLASRISMRLGSPPQVRGKRFPYRAHDAEYRITPAGAGKTSGCLIYRGLHKDHPRRCGENVDGAYSERISGRITPAGAGKTAFAALPRPLFRDHPRRCGENPC